MKNPNYRSILLPATYLLILLCSCQKRQEHNHPTQVHEKHQEITNSTLINRNKDCAFQMIEGKMVLIYPKEKMMHRLNEVGTTIWECIDKERTLFEIVDKITQEYEIDRATAEKDVKEFLMELYQKKLIIIGD